MTNSSLHLQRSARVMRVVGWALTVGLILMLFIYPPGFLWGTHPDIPAFFGPAHPASHLDGLHPYLAMLATLYLAYGILMIRGAKDPRANAALFDYGILANALHGLVMIPQSFFYPNEHAHLWADIPLLFAICLVLWHWHPNRIAPNTGG
jgi:hypothetical protein